MESDERKKYKVSKLFRVGRGEFLDGLPEPENRIKGMGWRLAKQEKLNYDYALQQAIEAYAELNR